MFFTNPSCRGPVSHYNWLSGVLYTRKQVPILALIERPSEKHEKGFANLLSPFYFTLCRTSVNKGFSEVEV
jgi:hypothetical protein